MLNFIDNYNMDSSVTTFTAYSWWYNRMATCWPQGQFNTWKLGAWQDRQACPLHSGRGELPAQHVCGSRSNTPHSYSVSQHYPAKIMSPQNAERQWVMNLSAGVIPEKINTGWEWCSVGHLSLGLGKTSSRHASCLFFVSDQFPFLMKKRRLQHSLSKVTVAVPYRADVHLSL